SARIDIVRRLTLKGLSGADIPGRRVINRFGVAVVRVVRRSNRRGLGCRWRLSFTLVLLGPAGTPPAPLEPGGKGAHVLQRSGSDGASYKVRGVRQSFTSGPLIDVKTCASRRYINCCPASRRRVKSGRPEGPGTGSTIRPAEPYRPKLAWKSF